MVSPPIGRRAWPLQALGGGVGGVDGDALHARVEGGVAFDDGRILGVGGQGLATLPHGLRATKTV